MTEERWMGDGGRSRRRKVDESKREKEGKSGDVKKEENYRYS